MELLTGIISSYFLGKIYLHVIYPINITKKGDYVVSIYILYIMTQITKLFTFLLQIIGTQKLKLKLQWYKKKW